MRKFINYFIYSIVVIPLIIFLLVLVLYGAYNLNRSYKIATIRYFIGESTSPNTQSTLKIYQKGGDSIVSLQTPLEFECTNQYGTTGFIKDIKMGHIYQNSDHNLPIVLWTEDMSGSVTFGRNPSVEFQCKTQ